MSLPVVVYVLTALAAVVVVLTRVRLGGESGSGRFHVGHGVLGVHTVAGGLAVVVWTVFLVADEDTAAGGALTGIVAIGLWWVVALAGLMLLARWLPSRGRHAADAGADRWTAGPALSVLAHLGMLIAVGVFTWAYLTSAV